MFARVEKSAGWLLVIVVLLILGSVVWSIIYTWQHTATIRLGNAIVAAKVASDDRTREKGLGGQEKLGMSDGLLIVYTHDNTWGVWMKDMKFPIDVIWLDKDKKVVHITKNIYPDTYPQVFEPEQQARYVLEIPAGTVDAKRIQIGQSAHFDLPSH